MAQRTATPRSAADPRQRARNLTLPILLTGSLAAGMHIAAPSQASASPQGAPRSSAPAPAPLPQSKAPVAVQAPPAQYTVASGDTVSSIAATFGVATASLLALNGLGWSSLIFPGQVLKLTGATATPAAAETPTPAPAPAPAPVSSYTVVAGDTVSGIASDHGISVAAILTANGLGSASIIYAGQDLAIPAAGTTPAPVAVSPPAPTPKPSPQASIDTVTPLSAEMAANARIIIGTARSLGVSDEGIVVALAAAAQESSLRNVQFGDRDSLGLFQQRPSQGWGTPEQLLDPVRATAAFFGGSANPNPGLTAGLLDIPGWTSMSVTDAAQAVQKSAHPDAYGKWETSARAWLSQLG
ncbi:LysM peptidoglycan-binding domain-containing protein [Mycetocola miduiensis]|uniref:LysM repeat-containing protein n=1 Tax=Mycetocola miduiensis TaxID=995034 RepID=A0A1I5A957_9MICO|nr:LysM peptidoglycan-binding domain-containing protein [Mycetocola miduiensis]SFN58986.1 LysM repeat-containing protein [Mycetocola miduiensis]